MNIEKPEFEKKPVQSRESIEAGREPIVDVEVNNVVLEQWKKEGLNGEIINLLNNGFEEKIPENGKFILSVENFKTTRYFIDKAEGTFRQFDAKNWGDKLDETRNHLRKIILNFTFKETDFDPHNPIIIKEEKIPPAKKGDKEITRKYFAVNRPDIVLVSDEIDWWLERKKE